MTTREKSFSLRTQIDGVRRQIGIVQGATRQLRPSEIAYEVSVLEAVIASLIWLQEHRDAIACAFEEHRGDRMNAQARRMLREL